MHPPLVAPEAAADAAEVAESIVDAPLHLKMIVLCTNSQGAPEFHTYQLDVSKAQYDEGEHYDLAKENAENNGYEAPMVAFDQNDEAAKELGQVYAWL